MAQEAQNRHTSRVRGRRRRSGIGRRSLVLLHAAESAVWQQQVDVSV